MGRILTISAIVLTLPALAAAQRGAGISAPHGPAPAGHASAPPHIAARASTSARMVGAQGTRSASHIVGAGARNGNGSPGSRTSRRASRTFFDAGQVDFQDAPGLGFDYPHLAAVSGNRRTHGSRFNTGFPFGGFLLSPSIIVEEPITESQSIPPEDAPTEAAMLEPLERPSRSRPRASVVEEPPATSARQPDAEQYVFVRRDGTIVFAVAYSWDNGSLRYVTPEGFRRTINSEALDLTATQQFNEQRGLTFRSPA